MGFHNDELVTLLPQLKKFAMKLTKNITDAEDLLHETAARMLEKREMFETGSNLWYWGSKVMFNLFVSGKRLSANKLNTQYDPEPYILGASVGPRQEDSLYCKEVLEQVKKLPRDQRNTVVAVAGTGSYEAAAKRMGVPIGTVRSRMSRARDKLEDGGRLRIATEAEICRT